MRCVLYRIPALLLYFFFFFNDTATTEIYTLSLHDALPIFTRFPCSMARQTAFPMPDISPIVSPFVGSDPMNGDTDRKSTRLNSSHLGISYAVFCLKKKNNIQGRAILSSFI